MNVSVIFISKMFVTNINWFIQQEMTEIKLTATPRQHLLMCIPAPQFKISESESKFSAVV